MLAEMLGMEIYYYDVVDKLAIGRANKCENLEDLLKNADIVTLHVDGRKENKNLITKKEFKLMKKTAFLINTSRGPIINEKDMIKVLEDEAIAGVGLDVYDKEPLPQDHKLRFLPNALLLPHLGYVTAENYTIFYSQMMENLESCLHGKPIRILA